MTEFAILGLAEPLLKSIEAAGFTTPTPIQSQAIPLVIEGRDLMGLAQTGTGKTAAFGLPMLHHLLNEKARPAEKSARALVLAPTRELVNQIADNLALYAGRAPLRVARVVGGTSINGQINRLRRGCDVLVATPGRLIDLLERRAVRLDAARFLVLDEADQMLDMGFIHALRKIARYIPAQRQTLLFSATMPKLIEELASTYLNDPIRVEVAPPGKTADKITQSVHFVSSRDKAALLRDHLSARPDLSLVFARTKHGAEKLMKHLVEAGFEAASIHGNKSQGQRDRALKAFRAGEIRVLVATDVAARGIDIPGVGYVYNYDLPEVPENYVHRIGRTARAGADGEAISFCAETDIGLLRDIEKLTGVAITVAGGEDPRLRRRDGGKPRDVRPRQANGHANGHANGAGPKRPHGKPNAAGKGPVRFGDERATVAHVEERPDRERRPRNRRRRPNRAAA